MTDNEIVKALECCGKLRYDIQQPSVCVNCPYYNLDDCTFELKARAFDLINRLQAENDKWQGGYMTLKQEVANLEIELKSKAEVERLLQNLQQPQIGEKIIKCNQLCPYNTLKGCNRGANPCILSNSIKKGENK